MDYYTRKARAIKYVKKMVMSNVDVGTIKLQILERFTLSDIFVDKYIEKLSKNGFIKVSDSGEVEFLGKIKQNEE